ncbi:MAG: hypothetical protein A2W01_03970 [Candidatus Solincola sediminis]|uniref:Uncharacterized protein n=1 Tax=Candidatus Solincola sediminis TaxID=1797199 RepID=A0A1F2WQ09_9ACTN|nr:MAG: hypothetical protein A2W01_03970 [Candidatus Solincola sediminis]OFW58919.1 MAG: hypothetical protein A2Y75_00040 [Candidatus Solincola sediminis]
MGFIALIVFLCSLAVFFICLGALGWAAREIYRTTRYAQKDSQVWIERFGEYNRGFQETVKGMQTRGEDITRMGLEMRESLDEMRDAVEELRSSRLLKAASFIGRRRTG